ncbi:hypothetical protein H632_c2138p1 [Helicosporidium sp. ATCC 50920]|nr:hypothetical protein H632_c2138p1 [Helicosporidium sp. ATCC 50920]|eukprot:KDD73475.1 hypothetical protein H632_c2138p1 [Helicosporidium sp. ATCC 50920]
MVGDQTATKSNRKKRIVLEIVLKSLLIVLKSETPKNFVWARSTLGLLRTSHPQQRKRTTSEPPLPKVKNDPVIWGVDPGRKNLFTAVNNRGQKLSCKTTRFYHDAYYTQSKKVIKDIYDKNLDITADFQNMPTNKTASLAILSNCIKCGTCYRA